MPPPRPHPGPSPQQMLDMLRQATIQQQNQLNDARRRIAALEARLALAAEGRTPRFPLEFRSQYGEDVWIWNLLGGQTQGFFIEAGAFDGYGFSVSYAFEAMGWNGLLVEALPEPFEKCRRRRVHSRVVHAALGRRGASGEAEFVSVQDQYGGMLSHLQGPTEHARNIAGSDWPKKSIRVPLTSLNELLKDHAGPIDAAVIDVEGGELDVLDGFDLDRFKPRVLLIEDNSEGRNAALGNYMSTKPYVSAGWLEVNRLYIRADEQQRLDRLSG